MFPLGSVLFPYAALPLHVFEPRYRALVEHCLAGEPEFGVVLIERGSEVGGGDTRFAVGTVARIVEVSRFTDGRYALVAVGTARLRVHEWLPDDPYPLATVEVVDEAAASPVMVAARSAVEAQLRRVLALATELGATVAPSDVRLDDDPVPRRVRGVRPRADRVTRRPAAPRARRPGRSPHPARGAPRRHGRAARAAPRGILIGPPLISGHGS